MRDGKPHYQSDIPAGASAVSTDGGRHVSYWLGGEEVGRRTYDSDGLLSFEIPRRSGRVHGRMYRFEDGTVSWTATYVGGREHGWSRQWAPDGRLLGKYRMVHGTGWDRFWGMRGLVEARHWRGGRFDGPEWYFLEGTRRLRGECWWREGEQHGVEYRWNRAGGVCRGYPRYWLDGKRVTRRKWLRAGGPAPDAAAVRPDGRVFPPIIERCLPPPDQSDTPR